MRNRTEKLVKYGSSFIIFCDWRSYVFARQTGFIHSTRSVRFLLNPPARCPSR
jgi:hypothetical protein